MKSGKGLMFRKTYRKTIEAYTNSDRAESTVDMKSNSGYRTFVQGNLVTLKGLRRGRGQKQC